MLEVEGGTPEWCMRILRHEAGHAIENAYRLRRRRRRRELFGSTRVPYPEYYAPRPYSKSFVMHLEPGTRRAIRTRTSPRRSPCGSTPESNWRERYAGWPALQEARVHGRADGGARRPAPRWSSRRARSIRSRRSRKTLRQHYEQKRAHYGLDRPDFYDRDLRRLFSDAPEHAQQPTAARFPRAASAARCAQPWPAGQRATSTRSTRCSRT